MNTTKNSNVSMVNGAAMDTSKTNVDFLIGLEAQMKNLWQQYIERLDRAGLDATAEDLKRKYFNLYRCYRMNKEWLQILQRKGVASNLN